jgi:hypothetical protein
MSSSGEGQGDAYSVGSLERAKLNYWTRLTLFKGPNRADVSHRSPGDGNRPSFLNVLFWFFRIPDGGQSPDTK